MELSIKNEKLIAHLQAEENSPLQQESNHFRATGKEDPALRQAAGKWSEEHPETVLYGYLRSFLEICEMHNIQVDLTYDTAKNLGAGLSALFVFQKKHYDHATNVDIVAKTLASVLSYLAINEHGYWFRSTRYLAQIKAGKGPNCPLWSNIDSVSVGRKNKYVDFLSCCKESVKPGTILIPNGLTIQIDPVLAEYKKLTGIDLAEHGLGNLFVS